MFAWFRDTLIPLVVFALFVVAGMAILAVVLPIAFVIGGAWSAVAWTREVWNRRSLSGVQRHLLRQLEHVLKASTWAMGRLEAPTTLDGAWQVHALELRNRVSASAFCTHFSEAERLLDACRQAGIPDRILQPVWNEALDEINLHGSIVGLSMRAWERDNPFVAALPSNG